MKTVNLTCIGCPMGCGLSVELNNNKIVSITGNNCKIWENYAEKELFNPTRIVTSTVCVNGGVSPRVSIKTEHDIPKGKIFECVDVLKNIKVNAPIKIGDIIIKDIAKTGVNIVATKNIERKY